MANISGGKAKMHWISEVFGALMDAVLGRSVTRIYEGTAKNASLKLRPSVNTLELDIGIESRQIVFETVFDRWWIPSVKRTVYEVVAHAPDEYRSQFHPHLFEKVTYPLLCVRMLKWTEYPHVYAIRAFLERIPHPTHEPLEVTL
jgi:hypothetical protein